MKRVAAGLLLLGVVTLTMPARPTGSETGQSGGSQNSSPTAATPAQQLLQDTMPIDIATASYYELVAWARRLGLSDKGTRSELQERLRGYYGITPQQLAAATPTAASPTAASPQVPSSSPPASPQAQTPPSAGATPAASPAVSAGRSATQQNGQTEPTETSPTASASTAKAPRTITITSARTAEYFTLENVGQKYIRLSGGVDLEMTDPDTNSTHSIIADTVVFNQSEKTITASGNIDYRLTSNGKTEEFHGESLTFNVDNWEGIFYNGVSQSAKTINNVPLNFYYSGKTIHRTAGDVVTLDNGSITSSDATPPNYQIRASKIWVLAPGEWALSNAVLYIGRVPLFYFPFFFHPGDDLFFNPSMGYDQERGYYLQTTTYLLGRRQINNSSFSFLQVAEDTNVSYNTQIRGLFLRKTTPISAEESAKTPYDDQLSFIKILLDTYSRLGVFAGIESNIANFGILKDFELNLGIARSRNIFLDENSGAYSQFYQTADGDTVSIWNTSSLGPLSLPFRYGADLELSLAGKAFTFTASLPFYSDPNFNRDFGDREEYVDWSKLLGLTGTNATTSASATTSTQPQPVSSFLWSLHTTANPTLNALRPYVTQLSVTAADASVYWQSKDLTNDKGIPGLDPNRSDYVASQDQDETQYEFPNTEFFYPQTVIFPSVQAQISGTIFSNAPAAAAVASAQQPAATQASPAGGAAAGARPASGASGGQAAGSGGLPASSAAKQPGGGPTTTVSTAPGAAESATPSATGTSKPPAPAAGGQTAQAPHLDLGGARAPWGSAQAGSASTESGAGADTVRTEDLRPDSAMTAPSTAPSYVHSLTYTIVPEASLQENTVSDSWHRPADINLGNAYQIWTARSATSLTYTGAFDSNLFVVQEVPTLSDSYKIHTNRVAGVSDWDSFLEQDYNTTFLKLTNSLTLSTYPLDDIDVFKGSNARYSLVTQLFGRTWDAGTDPAVFSNSYFTWDKDHVTTNSLSATLDVTPADDTDSFGVASILPPLDPQIVGTAKTGPLTSVVSEAWTIPDGSTEWVDSTLSVEETWRAFDWLVFDELVAHNYTQESTTSTSKVTATSSNNLFTAQQSVEYDVANGRFQDSTTLLKMWIFTMQYEAQWRSGATFALPVGWTNTSSLSFRPSTLSFGISYDYKSQPFWKNRITFETNLQTAWNLDLVEFTNNSLTLSINTTLSIFKFLDLTFTLDSEDGATYRYFPAYAAEVGQEPINPLTDFIDSIDIFDHNALVRSNFKMKDVDLKAVHHLGDWDLTVEYTGSPLLTTNDSGQKVYEWNYTVDVAVDWKPVPEIKSDVQDLRGSDGNYHLSF